MDVGELEQLEDLDLAVFVHQRRYGFLEDGVLVLEGLDVGVSYLRRLGEDWIDVTVVLALAVATVAAGVMGLARAR